jgi:UDP-N-acetylglucosamine acyltransferase
MPIHKNSIIHRDAQISNDVTIGPNSYIGPKVFIDSGAIIGPNVVIEGWTRIGKNCKISSGAVLGGSPQIVDHKEKISWVHIGENTVIREFVSIHRSSEENGITSVGSGAYLMAYSHVAHDCKIGDHVITTNYTGISGHVVIEEKAVIGGHVGIHQFIRIGKMAMVGGMTRLAQDVLPFSLVEGNPPRLYGNNAVGLRKNKIAPSVRSGLKKAFKFIARSNLNTSQALERIKQEIPESEELKYLCDFIEATKRGIHK